MEPAAWSTLTLPSRPRRGCEPNIVRLVQRRGFAYFPLDAPCGGSFLWLTYYQIDGSNVRIAGTMHVFPSGSPGMPDWLWRAYAWAEDIVIESDPEGILPHRWLPDGESLSAVLPPDTFAGLAAYRAGLPEPLEKLKPWAAFLALPQAIFPVCAGVESQFVTRAAADGRPVYSLETAEEIVRIFEGLPLPILIERLQFVLRNPATIGDAMLAMHAAWLARSLPDLFAVVSSIPLFSHVALREAILIRRNRAWMPKILGGIRSHRWTLFLVGALQLCGQSSVAELAEEQGHDISTVAERI